MAKPYETALAGFMGDLPRQYVLSKDCLPNCKDGSCPTCYIHEMLRIGEGRISAASLRLAAKRWAVYDWHLLDLRIDILEMSMRTTHALYRNDVTTLRQLVGYSIDELLQLNRIGIHSIPEITGALRSFKLRHAMKV